MNSTRTQLLGQILAVLGVSAGVSVVACGKSSVVAPDNAGDNASCPDAKGTYAADFEPPGGMEGPRAVCLAKPANGDCSSVPNRCVLSAYACGVAQGGTKVLDKLRSKEADQCCWKVEGTCAVGRPFYVDGELRVAELASGAGWLLDGAHDGSEAASAVSAALADVWARDGLTEHASVASFAQLVLELLALGAPVDLVLGAQEAMADEIRHAQRAFTLASSYAGAEIGPGPLPTHGAAARTPDLADFAARTAAEGCIAETVAALQLHASADAATDPEIAALLRTTAEEESKHATLAYRIVAWAIERGGEPVRAAVADVFAKAGEHVGFGPCPDDASDLRAHGVLSRRERHDLALAALRDVIAPAGAALAGRRSWPLCA